jgi:taurine transport system substrate-binding protein
MIRFLKLPVLGLVLAGVFNLAQAAEVTVAYQTSVDPAKLAQAEGEYEKATGSKINWRKFESGADVIAALASGDVQVGYVGSSPLAAAASRNVPFQIFLLAAELGTAEALVVRNGAGITKPADLIGKKVAVPFVSTTHYSLLAAFKHWNIAPAKVQVLNMRPAEINAAWQRGDIDAAYVWDPVLGKAKETGKLLVSSAQVAQWGAPTFDAWVARKDFIAKEPDFLKQFASVTLKAYASYRSNPKMFAGNPANLEKITRVTGAKAADIPGLLAGNSYPLAAGQSQLLGAPVTKALANTALFLKEQGKVDKLQSSYAPFVTNQFVR